MNSEQIKLYQGVPQSTLLRPLLLIIYVGDMRYNIAPYYRVYNTLATLSFLSTSNQDFINACSDLEFLLIEKSDYFLRHEIKLIAAKTEFTTLNKMSTKNYVNEKSVVSIGGYEIPTFFYEISWLLP